MVNSSLIEEVQSGSQSAFRRLFDIYSDKVYRTSFYILRDKQYAEDVVQEVFLKVYKSIHKLSKVETFDVWLYRITVNTCSSYFSKIKKMPLKDPQADADLLNLVDDNSLYNPGEQILQKDLKNKLLACINSLPAKHRTVLILFYYNDMNINQIASILGCTVGTIKSRLFYSKKKLKQILDKENINYEDENMEDIVYEIKWGY